MPEYEKIIKSIYIRIFKYFSFLWFLNKCKTLFFKKKSFFYEYIYQKNIQNPL